VQGFNCRFRWVDVFKTENYFVDTVLLGKYNIEDTTNTKQ